MEVSVQKDIFQYFPNMTVHGLIATNVQTKKIPTNTNINTFSINETIDTKALIKQWKEIYKQFPTDKKSRCSIEYLIWAFEKEKLRNIHPIVDLYNQASLLTLSPFGGEDIDALGSILSLSVAKGTESFIPLGKTEIENPKEQEIVWTTGDNIVCRSLNWIESDIYKITASSSNIVFVSERPSNEFPNPQIGIKFLENSLVSISDHVETFILDAKNNQFIY